MTDNTEIVSALAVAGMGMQKEVIGKEETAEYLLKPKDYELVDAERFMKAPRRIKESVQLWSVKSFIDYIELYGDIEVTGIFAKPNCSTPFTAIIDYHQFNNPAWCDHKVILKVENTPAWETWTKKEKTRFSQRDFLHYIEDNAEFITNDMAPLLQKIREVKVKRGSQTRSKVDDSGEEFDASGSLNVESGVPETLELALSIWRYSDPYKIKARVYTHIEEEKVYFSYHLINAERAKEQLFDEYKEKIDKGTKLKIYI